jgi:hypothetical protein
MKSQITKADQDFFQSGPVVVLELLHDRVFLVGRSEFNCGALEIKIFKVWMGLVMKTSKK